MTFPATDGITDRLQALFAYDASSPLIFSSTLLYFGSSIRILPHVFFIPSVDKGRRSFARAHR